MRLGPAGISVRNLANDKVIPWSDVVSVSFPQGARWARLNLPDYEYIPLMAIQSVDKDRAVAAMAEVRAALDKYQQQAG